MDSILMRFRDKFIEEARGLLDNLEVNLLGLERTPDNKELIDSAFRYMHTLKGVSGMYEFTHIYQFTHHFETIYQSIRDGQMSFNKTIFDLTFSSIDHIRNLLTDENLSNPVNIDQQEKLITQLNAQKINSDTTPTPAPVLSSEKTGATWHILLHTNEKQFFRGINFTGIFKDLAGLGEFSITKVDSAKPGEFDTWSIYLYSSASEADIKELFLFIEDDCILNRITGGNIISSDQSINPIFKYREEEFNIPEPVDMSLMPKANNLFPIEELMSATGVNETAPVEKSKELFKEFQARVNVQINSDKVAIKRISVDSQKLDNLMFLVSELITVNSQFLVSSSTPEHSELRPLAEKVDQLSKQFRNNALEIRLVPISETVVRFQRLVRDLSTQLHKKVEFVSQGAETELDKNIIVQLTDPLMHLIRNSLDHGIELPSERIAKGKPEAGTLKLTAVNTGNFVFITIEDDGAGLDNDKIVKKAVEKGLISANDQLSDKEIHNLIFHPGFSTAENVTEVSGRGVGMDVVKRRIAELRGEISIDSERGKGSRITLKLQQSLSIIDSLLFRVGHTYFIIPFTDIEVCDQTDAFDIEQNRHTSTIPYGENLIYFCDLHQLLDINNTHKTNSRMIIVSNETCRMALLVDQIIGEHQAVLKPLGESFKNQKFITSVSQLGDGNNAFMIDTGAIIRDSTAKLKGEIEIGLLK